MRGMQYWSINTWPPTGSPYTDVTDITPVNGDGMLVYPGADGPVNSIRWENIRDGLEDYDYLTMFMEQVNKLKAQSGNEAVLKQAAEVYNLQEIVPSLVTFTRDPEVLLKKRQDIAVMIDKLGNK